MPILDRTLVRPGAELYTDVRGIHRTATVVGSPEKPRYVLDDGRVAKSISALACLALPPTARVRARNGWVFWCVKGELLPPPSRTRRRRKRAKGAAKPLVPGSPEFLRLLGRDA